MNDHHHPEHHEPMEDVPLLHDPQEAPQTDQNPPSGTPTQIAHPNAATARTVAQVAISVVVTLGVVAPIVLSILQEEMGAYIPPSVMGWLIGGSAFIVALSAVLTRVMAIPALQPFLVKIGLGTGVEKER